jgi:hypothetical protein
MKDSGQGAGRAQVPKPDQLATVSKRKLQANRENAKKSTGPKTRKGKECSRRNALKHGLFAMNSMDFDVLHEDPEQYQELLEGLREQYQPSGEAEELEVERVALCWWRLKRVWRYENVVNRVARRDFTWTELDRQDEWLKEQDKEADELIVLLQSAKKEIEDGGQISQELKQKMFMTSKGLESIWSGIEGVTQEKLKEPEIAKLVRRLSAPDRSSLPALQNVIRAVGLLEWLRKSRHDSIVEIAVGQNAIPNCEALDRILRYETTIERNLSRALDRLERLQRRRRGELVPRPLSVHLTQ